MEGSDKVRELEEELKLLKAEVKNVLLDLREVVLARSNPLAGDLVGNGASDGAEASAAAGEEGPRASAPTPQAEEGRPLRWEEGQAGPKGTSIPPRGEPQWPAGSEGDMVAWVMKALDRLGPRQVEHLLAMYRLLKPLPPNVGRALGHLQELVRTSEGPAPSWLQALKELDQLAGS